MKFEGFLFLAILISLLFPLAASIFLSLLVFIKKDQEKTESRTYNIVLSFFSLTLINSIFLFLIWCFSKNREFHFELFRILVGKNYHFDVTVFFDGFGAVYLLCASIISNLIVYYSHRYLHNDPGYQRFFIIISLFYFGINLEILSGGLNTIFAGWEVMGLASFLLISYFWHRPKAAAQAAKAYYIYRITDIGLLASVFISHFLWHGSHLFVEINSQGAYELLQEIPLYLRWLLSLCILLPVLGKSAQFPFCFWLPRAMEGPTHSSAIFYGSLSIHAGVFLLIRTVPIWQSAPGMNILLIMIGLLTALMATLCAQVQANIKGQIGYASIAQVGLMLIFLGFGFINFAFFHMIGNAFLRSFQLLVSSSILTTHLQIQGIVTKFNQLSRFSLPNIFLKNWQASLYVLAINEGYLEPLMKRFFINPLMIFSHICNKFFNLLFKYRKFNSMRNEVQSIRLSAHSMPILIFVLAACSAFLLKLVLALKILFLFLAAIMAFSALGEKRSAKRAILFCTMSYFFCFFSTIILSWSSSHIGLVYLFGFLGSVLLSLDVITYVSKRRSILAINRFNGLYSQFPHASAILLLGFLGIIGFPLCSTFIGEEILLNINKHNGISFMLIFHLIFILNGISLIRLYSFIFFGRRGNIIEDTNLDYTALGAFCRLLLFLAINILSFFMVYV